MSTDSKKTEKKVNKKYLLVLLTIFLAFFLIIIVVAFARACSRPGSNYKRVEGNVLSAAKKYYNAHKDELPEISESTEITASTLSEKKYMKPLTSMLKDTSCEAKVTVYNNSGFYLYIPDLKCAEYKTSHLVDVIKKDNLIEKTDNTEIDETGKNYVSGLYYENGRYIFKGKHVNNYFKFGNIIWRIIDIDDNGIIRVVKNTAESRNYYWDTQYNIDVKSQYGKNDFKNSLIREKLNNDFSKFKDESKLHLAPFDICIGKREKTDLSKYSETDCSVKLENQYIGLVSVSDFAFASLDENCVNINSGSCRNYNYLSTPLNQTWTASAIADNTYEVYYLSGGIPTLFQARTTNPYNWVVAFNGNELYTTGKGTEKEPYTISNSK